MPVSFWHRICAVVEKKKRWVDLLIADKIRMAPTERYKVQPTLAYISPEAETEKHRAEVGTAYLDFQVGKSADLAGFP